MKVFMHLPIALGAQCMYHCVCRTYLNLLYSPHGTIGVIFMEPHALGRIFVCRKICNCCIKSPRRPLVQLLIEPQVVGHTFAYRAVRA